MEGRPEGRPEGMCGRYRLDGTCGVVTAGEDRIVMALGSLEVGWDWRLMFGIDWTGMWGKGFGNRKEGVCIVFFWWRIIVVFYMACFLILG